MNTILLMIVILFSNGTPAPHSYILCDEFYAPVEGQKDDDGKQLYVFQTPFLADSGGRVIVESDIPMTYHCVAYKGNLSKTAVFEVDKDTKKIEIKLGGE